MCIRLRSVTLRILQPSCGIALAARSWIWRNTLRICTPFLAFSRSHSRREQRNRLPEQQAGGVTTYLHLEGDLKIRGMQLEKFPTDDELFMHWEEFCASYANAQKEHLLMQHEVVRDCIAS